MPFCTACGKQNPDDARFCSQCGHRLVTDEPAHPADGEAAGQPAVQRDGKPDGKSGGKPGGGQESTGETTSTLTFGGPVKSADHSSEESSLNDADAAAVDALPAGSALLVVQRGPSAGSRFLLDTDLVSAGRHPDSEIFLDDVTVSRRHAEFRRGPDGFRVADVGSLNGTYVNRDRIDEVGLQGGDEVQIGKYRLVYFASHSGGDSAR